MNKIAKTSLGIAAVAALAGAGAYMAFAWGPSRDTYTMQKPADHVVFNSITDNNNEVGDERYFVSASEYTGNASNNYWSDKTQVENGKEYVVRMYVHNNAASNLNLTAENVRAYVVLPTDTATSITVSGKIYSSNANPTTVWDETTFTSKNGEKFNLAYVDGTAKYYNTKDGKLRTFNLNASNLLTSKGELLGYDQMDGKIPGCSQYSGYVTFHVKAQFAEKPAIEVSKEVKILGSDTWSEEVKAKSGETVRYRIHVKNSGNTTLQNVVVRDILPTGLTYVAGSTTIVNTAHPKGVALSDGIVTDKGINLGDYAAGAGAWLYFNATVDKAVSEKCNNTLLRNVIQASAGTTTGTKEDTADVLVDGKVCVDGFTIDKMVKLPSESEWHETITAKGGSTVDYRIRFTNTGNTTLNNVVIVDTLPENMSYIKNSSKLDGKAVADGVESKSGLNIGSVAAGKTATLTFQVRVSDLLSDKCEDSTLTNTAKGKYNNDDKTAKSDTAVVKVNGKICEPEQPGFKIDKMVQLDGGKEWSETVNAKAGDKVRYRIQFKNTGNTTLKNVVIRDNLPAGMTYVSGSTVLYNKANTNGKTLSDGIVSKSGINIGSYDKGTEATIYFYATVNESLKDNCEDSTLTNVADSWYNGDIATKKSDTADTKVAGKTCEEPVTPELPKTGAASMISGIIGAASVATAAGYYIISRKK
ncbi:MAG: LPXTG cell wall anchor domain-containing protein [Candidatus Saccharibacteria bacterium]|jgi:uncharacterized repeat protein (TIGR01451 family)/LPXTG-motif cell wall-anchored protein|nr:LPXTG cell wall anchor domain-containing protein [Candidatus Saccharibacteria bacterium]